MNCIDIAGNQFAENGGFIIPYGGRSAAIQTRRCDGYIGRTLVINGADSLTCNWQAFVRDLHGGVVTGVSLSAVAAWSAAVEAIHAPALKPTGAEHQHMPEAAWQLSPAQSDGHGLRWWPIIQLAVSRRRSFKQLATILLPYARRGATATKVGASGVGHYQLAQLPFGAANAVAYHASRCVATRTGTGIAARGSACLNNDLTRDNAGDGGEAR